MEKATEPARAERKAGRSGVARSTGHVIDEERVLKAPAPRLAVQGIRDLRGPGADPASSRDPLPP